MTHTPNSAEQLSEKLDAFADAYHDWRDWFVNGYGNDYDQVSNEKEATYERLRGELLAEATPPAAAPAPAVPDEGKLWSLIHSVMKQGVAIHFDHIFKPNDLYNARMDAAASERVPQFLALLAATPAAPAQEPVTLAPEEVDKVIEGETGFIGLGTCALDKSALRKIVYESIAALREKESGK